MFFRHYLHDRMQRVALNGKLSDFRIVWHPPAICLGPILYSIYTLLLPRDIRECSVQVYADDTQIFSSFYPNRIKKNCSVVINDLEIISKIFSEESLRLNLSKCCCNLFGRRVDVDTVTKLVEININCVKLEAKSLGVITDNRLRFVIMFLIVLEKLLLN